MSERERKINFEKQRGVARATDALLTSEAQDAAAKLKLLEEGIEHQLNDLELAIGRARHGMSRKISALERNIAQRLERGLAQTERARSYIDRAEVCTDKDLATLLKENEKLKKENEKLRQLSVATQLEIDTPSTDPRAATLAILDSVIFAIGNWSTEGDTAPDFELACQSVLFPTIYERVMNGEDDYFLEEVPVSAMEVVKRGREYVKMLRSTCEGSLVAPEVWESQAGMIQEWWIRDALPLLYGARSEDWDNDTPLSLIEVLEWRDQPASRALHFPLIFDGMALVEKSRDQIRETTNLPEFNKNTLQTRLQP